MDGKFNFSGELMNNVLIINQGKIEVGNGGFVYLIVFNVENIGYIIVNVGCVILVNDGFYDIDLIGNGLVIFLVIEVDLIGVICLVKNGLDGKIEVGYVLFFGSEISVVMLLVVNQGEIIVVIELILVGDDLE